MCTHENCQIYVQLFVRHSISLHLNDDLGSYHFFFSIINRKYINRRLVLFVVSLKNEMPNETKPSNKNIP